MKKIRRLKGQELVEFALILPVMVVILVAIAEMGFMWTLRGTVSDAVKSSVQQMQLIAGQTEGGASTILETNIKNYLQNHGVPNAGSVQVTLNTSGENTAVNVTYKYKPTFTLPNFFGITLLPDEMVMGSSQVINSAIFGPNNFAGGSATGIPAAVNPASPTSVLTGDPTDTVRKQMAFVIDLPGNVDKIVNWWGHDIMTANSGINSQTGEITIKDPGTGMWTDTGESYTDLLLINGYTSAIYVNGAAGIPLNGVELPGSANIYDGELGGLSWCSPASSGTDTCSGDLTANATTNASLLAQSIYDIGKGYEVLTPVPSSAAVDAVTLPSGDLVADNAYRDVKYASDDMAKLRFYVPRSVVESNDFVPPAETARDLTNATDQENVLKQGIDTDGDGVPNYFEEANGTNPYDADEDKNNIIDGYQAGALGTAKVAYDYKGWAIQTGTGVATDGRIPTYGTNTVNTEISASQMVADLKAGKDVYVSPLYKDFADKTCAETGNTGLSRCDNTRAYFLKVNSVVTTASGSEIRVASNNADSAYYATEKYRDPDPNRKVFEVEVITRDFDKDGVIELDSVLVVPVSDDGNNDGKSDASNTDTANANMTRGLLFVDGMTGYSYFNNATDDVLGYPQYNPASDLDYSPGDKL